MKHILFTILILLGTIMSFSLSGCQKNTSPEQNLPPESVTKFEKVKIIDVHPLGWIKTFLERQQTGLTGNIEAAGYPFDTCMWGCEKMEGSTKAWWPYEQTAYYLDGAHRLGLLLDNDELIQKAASNMQYVRDHIDQTGRIGTTLADRWWRWPYAQFGRLFMTEYETTGDMKIVEMLHKHYLTFDETAFSDDLELANIEQLCWLYGITKDAKLLEIAEKAYAIFKSDINNRNREGSDIVFGSDRSPDHHAVVFLELVKIPAILYRYTGKKSYLDEALNGIRKMEKDHMLISGLPSSTEHFVGVTEVAGSETCNIAVLPHTYGYVMRITGDAILGDHIERAVFNAGLGAITKDFKTHQYFSAPNQVSAGGNTNPFGHAPARMAYLPGHDVECCTGNVNRFMPYFVEQMWMLSPADKGIAAALFGPSAINAKLGLNQDDVTITAETNYPFSEEIKFIISTESEVKFPFYLRIPAWASGASISINGKLINEEIPAGGFYKLDRTFANGDVVSLTLPMKVVPTNWPNNGIAIERGPLVFSLPIDAIVSNVPDNDKSTPEFPGLEMQPNSAWQYALSLSGRDAEINVIQNESDGYPWDKNSIPIKIQVPAKVVKDWQMKQLHWDIWNLDLTLTPAFPAQLNTEEETQLITLVPYGSTELRMTVFPNANLNNND